MFHALAYAFQHPAGMEQAGRQFALEKRRGEAEHVGVAQQVGTHDEPFGADELLDRGLGHPFADGIVDTPAGRDDLGMDAEALGLVEQVVGIDADAVPSDQPRAEGQEVPLRAGGGQDFQGVDIHG